MLLDITPLRTFVVVADTGSFTRAAGIVNLTQSAVSVQIRKVEEQIGRRLFERNSRQLELTAEGEILLPYARRIVALHDEARRRLGHSELKGVVRLGAPEYFSPQTLASLLALFKGRYPSVHLEIEMGIGPDIAALFDKGVLDVAIVNREISDEGDDTGAVLYQESRVWAAAPGFTLSPSEPVPLALFPPHCAWRRLILDRLAATNRTWIATLQCTGLAGLVTAVEAGLAVAVFAESGLTEKMQPLGSAAGLPHMPDFEYVVHRSARSSAAADRLRDVIVDYFRVEANLRGRKDAHTVGRAISTRKK
jgi:DNA-binding transcriptional LysR family regulator